MVLQREQPITIWGWGEAGESVTVRIGTENRQAKANPSGEWRVTLPAMKAGGPHTVSISGSSSLEFTDVLVGEVWLCSGQSNMEMGIGASKDGSKEIAAADHPMIRLLMVANLWTPQPQTNFAGTWKVCTPASVAESGWGGFSAAGYYFGRELHQKLNVPIGLIDATWGGTRIESWTPPEGFGAVPALKQDYERVQLGDPRTEAHQAKLQAFLGQTEAWLTAAREASKRRNLEPTMPVFPAELLPPRELQNSTALFNGMIHPLCPFGMRGAIWYQGESNASEGMLYTERMKALIAGWRTIWHLNDLAFYYVQIAPYNYGGSPQMIGEFWEAQAAAQAIPNVGMAVINDIGDLKDIHPANKQEVGRRLALLALAKTYQQPGVICSGPIFKSMTVEGDKLRIAFDQTGTGLASRDGKPLNWFEIIDADEGGFVEAEARIDGSSVILSAPAVKKPVAMRFAWSMLAEPNLVNSAGLPTSAFRAGNAPKRDLLALSVPEAKQYQVLYDLDLGKLGAEFSYAVDNCKSLQGKYDRVAYFVELQAADESTQFIYVSMDAFTEDPAKLGVPTVSSGINWQQPVKNLNVISNVKGIRAGTGLSGGNLEFWPNNYGPENAAKVPNANPQVYDFGDSTGIPADGYGSMQVNDADSRQTLFAINNWKAGASGDLGIGNQPKGNPDWTFAANAGSYKAKRLRVLVRMAN
jgi:sialate O-acetylesterase